MSQKREDIVNKLQEGEAAQFGLNQNDLDDLHASMNINEEVGEEAVAPVAAKKPPVKKKAQAAKSQEESVPVNPRDLLKNITIDVNDVEIVDKSPMEKMGDIEFLLNGKPTYQVVANQSAYSAHMESIRLADINALTNSTAGQYESKQRLYKTVFSKINTTSVGRPNADLDFKTWLKITSFFDLPTFMYGMYCQTFPGDTNFDIKCRHCGEVTEVTVNNDTLVSVKDEATYEKLQEIINSSKTPQDLINESLVNQYTRSILPADKIMVDIQTPSLWDHLNLLDSVDNRFLEEFGHITTTMLFVKDMYVVDMDTLRTTGKVRYTKVEDRNQQFRILRNMEVEDAKALGDAIGTRTDRYAIEYKIKDHDCDKCGKSIGEIAVDMEEMLFTQILQM
jgi:hypothetical protein